MPASVVKYIEVPHQMKDETEAETVDGTGGGAGSSTDGALGGNFIVNVLLAGSLDQVWSLINSLQIAQIVRLFNVMTPGNVNDFTEFFDMATNLQIIEYGEILEEYVYVPEQEPKSLAFQNAGYDTSLFVQNSSSFLAVYIFHFSQIVLIVLLKFCCCKTLSRVKSFKSNLVNHLFWNGSIRLYIEAYMDLCLFSAINLVEMEWPEGIHIVTISNYLTYIAFGLCGALPIVLTIYVCCYKTEWRSKKFKNKAGTLIEGTTEKAEFRFYVAIFPIVFFTRRLLSAATLIFWGGVFFG